MEGTLEVKETRDIMWEPHLQFPVLNGEQFAWVYVSLGGHKYSRRRIRLERISGPLALLASGPEPGTPVVTDGAAELFGTEFGGGK